MCIINEPAEVHETELFVAPHSNGIDQITVYANEVKTDSTNNMMLLPVPNPQTVQFIDLQNYQSIFEDLEEPFKRPSRSFGMDKFSLHNNESRSLAVHDVGSYKATLVPTHADLGRINVEVFGTVQGNIKDLLGKQYEDLPVPFGYIICKLRAGQAVKYHPFAYRHKMAVDKEGKKVLFVPTRHEHGHAKTMGVMNPIVPSSVNGIHDPNEADWDHAIYSINSDMKAGNREQHSRAVNLKTDKIPKFDIGSIRTINKKVIKGYYPNNDLIFGLA